MEVHQADEKMEVMETEKSPIIKLGSKETVTSDKSSNHTDPAAPPHPYADQLSNFRPCPDQLIKTEVKEVPSLESTPFTIVSTQDAFNGMLKKLKEVKEMAIGVQMHSYRSFHDIVCFLGIATCSEDFLVDALTLKEELNHLNEVFTDDSVLKVMYFAERDLERLQRGLGLYMINLMDIAVADRIIGEASGKKWNIRLALKCHCDVDLEDVSHADDWKIRPLSGKMIKFARQRIHYLLHIKDKKQNNLVEKKCVQEVYDKCTKICANMWYPGKHSFKPDAYLATYNRTKGRRFEGYNQQQIECLRLIFEWRWRTAEANDESFSYTMPNKIMLQIPSKMPPDIESLKKQCGETIPPLVEKHLEDINKLILKAIENVPDGGDAVPFPKVKTKRGSRGRGDPRSGKNNLSRDGGDAVPFPKVKTKRGSRGRGYPRSGKHISRDAVATKLNKTTKTWKPDKSANGSKHGGNVGRGFYRGRGFRGRGYNRGFNPHGIEMNGNPVFPVMHSNFPDVIGPRMGPVFGSAMNSGVGLIMGPGMGAGMGPHMGLGMGLGRDVGQCSGMGPRMTGHLGIRVSNPGMGMGSFGMGNVGMGFQHHYMGIGMGMDFDYNQSW